MATSTIARTVEDTSRSTSELAQKVQRLAQVAADVSQNIREISHEIQRTTLGAAQTFSSTEALSKMAIQLRKSIRQFKA
jgi:methyl-accepting chemotaxis protein